MSKGKGSHFSEILPVIRKTRSELTGNAVGAILPLIACHSCSDTALVGQFGPEEKGVRC